MGRPKVCVFYLTVKIAKGERRSYINCAMTIWDQL